MPLRADDSFLPQLERCRQSGVTVVALNVGMDSTGLEQSVRLLAHFRHFVQRHPERYLPVHSLANVYAAKRRVAAVLFILIAGAYALGHTSPQGPTFSNLTAHGGFAPFGFVSILAGVTTVIFSLCGAEICKTLRYVR